MAKKLSLEELTLAVRDANAVVSKANINIEYQLTAFQMVLRELLDNQYTD